jgi:hypothetical protein
LSEFPGVAITSRALGPEEQETADNDWERAARERFEDDRLGLRGGAAPDISMFGCGRLALETLSI